MILALWLICLIVTSPSVCRMHSVENSRYECGAHGKFEYCIDDIPGCVIGCHCHPGYYFDTDTKICEPNTKLTENFRRRYVVEPTRVYDLITPTSESTPTPTNRYGLDDIGKETDELGDWLYNQFFKTIESQVINKTNDKIPTRRRGGNPIKPSGGGLGTPRAVRKSNNYKIKRKRHKSLKRKGKKRKSKGDGLRRKLLRITEDDSLFDSDSDSDESGSDSSSSAENSSSDSSSSETSKEHTKNGTDDREHGHKKVVIFNRRPRPPLPSFIILPNMDTPYYPPLGLPPPPIVPMYPIVPIPPISPFLPFLEKSGTNTSTTIITTIKPVVSSVADSSPTESSVTQTDEPSTPAMDMLRNKKQKHVKSKSPRILKPLKIKSEEAFIARSRDTDSENALRANDAERLELMQQLKARLKMKHKTPSALDSVIDELDEDMPLIDNIPTEAPSMHNSYHRPSKNKETKLKDFKYLSELIHRSNFSNTNTLTTPRANNKKKSDFFSRIPNIRRDYNPHPPQIYTKETTTLNNSLAQDPESTYFMNLGRKIASLVRTANPKVETNNNKAKDQNIELNSILPVLHENRYPSRSYWERSVRSPLIKLKNYFSGLSNRRENNNENILLNLENEVNTFASTIPPMTLQELENILSTLQKEVPQIDVNRKTIKQLKAHQNINPLLDNPTEIETYSKTFSEPYSYAKYVPQRRNLQNINDNQQEMVTSNKTSYIESSNFDLSMADDWMFENQEILPMSNRKQEISNLQPLTIKKATSNDNDPKHYSNPTKEFFPLDANMKQNKTTPSHNEDLLSHDGLSLVKDVVPKYSDILQKQSENPEDYNGLSIKYTNLFDKESELPKAYLDLNANYQNKVSASSESPTRYHQLRNDNNLLKKYSVLPASNHELPLRYPSLFSKYHESFDKYHEIPVKHYNFPTNYHKYDTPAKYHELSASHPDMAPKYMELSGKSIELPKNNSVLNNTVTNLPELYTKYSETPLKESDLTANLTDQTRRNTNHTKVFSSSSTIFDNKRLNFFSDIGGKGHYTFEASYPLHIPSYRKTFSKRVESPSYFHHELHHFDYFE